MKSQFLLNTDFFFLTKFYRFITQKQDYKISQGLNSILFRQQQTTVQPHRHENVM